MDEARAGRLIRRLPYKTALKRVAGVKRLFNRLQPVSRISHGFQPVARGRQISL